MCKKEEKSSKCNRNSCTAAALATITATTNDSMKKNDFLSGSTLAAIVLLRTRAHFASHTYVIYVLFELCCADEMTMMMMMAIINVCVCMFASASFEFANACRKIHRRRKKNNRFKKQTIDGKIGKHIYNRNGICLHILTARTHK